MSAVKRKTRITKEEVQALREQKKNYNSNKAKKTIKPGPWTNVEPSFKVKATLRPTPSVISTIPDFLGAYKDIEAWGEKGWYPVIFNVQVSNLQKMINDYGQDLLLAAIEKSLNLNPKLKDLVLLRVLSVNLANNYVGIEAKTNRKSIPNFTAIRNGKYVLLGAET